jgi:hypothetical protein
MALHCTMTYYGEEGDGLDLPRQWHHYLVIASPGTKPDSGVASILMLSATGAEGTSGAPSHTILTQEGGPNKALEMAEEYLSRRHSGLKRIISKSQG